MQKWIRSLSCGLAMGLILTASGCSGRPQKPEGSVPPVSEPQTTSAPPALPEALELYQASTGRLEELKALAGSMKVEWVMSMGGTSMTIPVEAQFEAEEKEDVTLMHMLLSVSVVGQTMEMEMWQDGEYTYTSAYGEKIREPLTEESDDPLSMERLEKIEESAQESIRQNASVTEIEDGYQVTFRMPGGDLSAVLDLMMEMTGEAGTGETGVSYSDIELDLTFDKEFMLRTMSINGSMTDQLETPDLNNPEQTVTLERVCEFSMEFTLEKYGDEVTVTMPEDLDAFEEPSWVTDEMAQEIIDSLFDEYGNYVENFDEVYAQLVSKYGQENVDEVLSWILGTSQI